MYHVLQCREGLSFRESEKRDMVTLEPNKEATYSLPVVGGRTVELCLAQFWSSLGETWLDGQVKFRGLTPDRRELTLTADEPLARVDVTALAGEETLVPTAKLETHRRVVQPAEAAIRPLSPERDTLPDGRLEHELVLTYKFEQAEAASVTPRFPLNDQLLYDSDFGTQLWLLFDAAKRRVATGDVFPKAVSLGKGQHLLKLQLRHSDVEALERVKQMPLLLDQPLASPLTLGIYPSRTAAVAESAKVGPRTLQAGEQATLYVKSPAASQLPGGVTSGLLLGTITYGKAEPGRAGAGDRPGGHVLKYVVSPASAKPPDSANTAAKTADSKDDPLPALVAKLHKADEEAKREERVAEIVAAADAVISQIDTAKLAQHFGTNARDDEQAAAETERMKKQKETLVDALYRKGRALGYMELSEVVAKTPIADKAAHDKAFEDNFAELRRWADTTDNRHFLLHVRRERRAGRPGLALEALQRHLPGLVPDRHQHEKRLELLTELGWKHWEEYERRWLLIRFPQQYDKF
jgi:tripeptidyl-peptidase-2